MKKNTEKENTICQ